MDTLGASYFVRQGSIYNPGWEVVERKSERHLIALATFEEKADAEEFLVYLHEQVG